MTTKKKQVKEVSDIRDRDPLPETFETIEEMAEFWDTHSTADYEDLMEEVEVEISPSLRSVHYFAIERDLAKQLRVYARQQGVSAETLLNLWVQEKLAQKRS